MKRFMPYVIGTGLLAAFLGLMAALASLVLAQPNTAPDWPFAGPKGDVQRRKEYNPDGDRVGVNLKLISGTPTPAPSPGRCQVICAGATPSLQVALNGTGYQQIATTGAGGVCACTGTGINSYAGGASAAAAGDNSVVIGETAGGGLNSDNAVCIGQGVTCDDARTVLIGRGISPLTSEDTIAIGYNLVVNADDAICIATNTCDATANVAVLGSDTSPMDSLYLGKGQYSASPSTVNHRGTNGSGTDIGGGHINIGGGAGTGTGEAGDVRFLYCPAAGGSGAGLNPCGVIAFFDGEDGFLHFPDNFGVYFGDGNDSVISFDGSDLQLDAGTGFINSNSRLTITSASGGAGAVAIEGSEDQDLSTVRGGRFNTVRGVSLEARQAGATSSSSTAATLNAIRETTLSGGAALSGPVIRGADDSATTGDLLSLERPSNTYQFRVTNAGEVYGAGIGEDGTGKAVCIKADKTLGTCTDAVGGSGTCTCS